MNDVDALILGVGVTGTSEKLRLQDDGKLGLNVTPTELLHVKDTASPAYIQITGPDAGFAALALGDEAAPKAGVIRNGRSQSQRWKMLKRAMAINRTAALSSTSWGLGQVMGIHWNWLDYGSVDALVRLNTRLVNRVWPFAFSAGMRNCPVLSL